MTDSILVTGGAGYIGSHTCKALAQAGYRPIVLDNLSTGHEAFVKWGPLVRGDVHDSGLVRDTLIRHDVAGVIHFAASSIVSESDVDPLRYYHNNVGGTLGLLHGMRLAGMARLIFSSTCAIYGDAGEAAINEIAQRKPVNVYGQTKLICEDIIAQIASAQPLNCIALRYFNASGADLEGEIGERREVETHLIPRALMALQGHVDDFQVFGTDFDTPDGTAIRDYIHVVDLAQAHVAALRRVLAGQIGPAAFNLGAGSGHSVRDVLAMITDVSGRDLPAPVGARRPGDPPRLVADASLARRELGFDPTHSDLRTIISSAWRWHLTAHPARPRGLNENPVSAGPTTP